MTLTFSNVPDDLLSAGLHGYRAATDGFTFSIVTDGTTRWEASVKPIGGNPFDGATHRLGSHGSLQAAQAACAQFLGRRS